MLAVLDARRVARTVLVGCSKGGQIAFAAALQHPDRVAALVLVGSAPPGAPPSPAGDATDALFAAIEDAFASGDFDLTNELEQPATIASRLLQL